LTDIDLIVSNCHEYCTTRFPILPPTADLLRQACLDLLRQCTEEWWREREEVGPTKGKSKAVSTAELPPPSPQFLGGLISPTSSSHLNPPPSPPTPPFPAHTPLDNSASSPDTPVFIETAADMPSSEHISRVLKVEPATLRFRNANEQKEKGKSHKGVGGNTQAEMNDINENDEANDETKSNDGAGPVLVQTKGLKLRFSFGARMS
jgi:hypothetical protein